MNSLEKAELLLTSTKRTEEETLGIFIALNANLEAHKLADEQEEKGPMMVPRKTFVDEKQDALIKESLDAVYTIGRMFTEAGETLSQACEELPEEKKNKYKEEMIKGMATLSSLNENLGILKHNPDLLAAHTMQEVLSLSFETVQWIYKVGSDYFEKGDDGKALGIFTVLVYLNSLSPDAWLALGLTQQRMQNPSDAHLSFFLASRLDPQSVANKYNLIKSYLTLQVLDKAREELLELEKLINEQMLTHLNPLVDDLKATIVKGG